MGGAQASESYMARRGVTQEDVNEAADQLLLAGERPTIERVRNALGTGSPNTLIRLLDMWWGQLGARLHEQAARIKLPEAPAEVASIADELWERALQVARVHAEERLAEVRKQLGEDRTALEEERGRLEKLMNEWAEQVVAAKRAESHAVTRLADAERLVESQVAQLEDLVRQRDVLAGQTTSFEQATQLLHDRLHAQASAAAAERDRLAEHARLVEDRAHAEVDRVREELRAERRDRKAAEREHALALEARDRELAVLGAAVAESKRELAHEQARAQAMEQQLVKLGDLPKILEATLSRARRPRGRAAKPRPSGKPSG